MNSNQKGFTLLEMMIVVAIIGVIAAFAIPAYQHYVLETNRKVAIADMLSVEQKMERAYTINNGAYRNPFGGDPRGRCNGGGELTSGTPPRYAFSLVIPADRQSYTLTARPCALGGQDEDKCGYLRLSSDGTRQVSPDKDEANFTVNGSCF